MVDGNLDGDIRRTGNALPDGDALAEGKKIRTTGAEVELPDQKKRTDLDAGIEASEVLETAAQAFQSATRAAGNAIDENRDLNSDDAVNVIKDMTPGVREYEATKSTLVQRRLEGLERRDRIRQLQEKQELTLDEEIELNHLVHEEKRNPDSAGGDLSALIVDKAQSYVDQMKERKKAEGRAEEADSFIRDGLPMAAEITKDAVNVLNPINQIGTPIAEGLSEVDTWEERQAWASQRDAITQYLNSEAIQIDKSSQRATDKLNQLLADGDLTDPDVQKEIDGLMAALRSDRERLEKLNALAGNKTLGVDHEKIGPLLGLKRSMPDLESLEDWRYQVTREQEKAKSCPEQTVRLSDENNQLSCVPCDVLYADFSAAAKSGDRNYARSLVELAPNCGWAAEADAALQASRSCPAGTVKLSDQNDNVECVSCDVLYADFSGALSGGDRAYAETLADLGGSCGWSRSAANELVAAQSCPDGTVKLSDQNGSVQCVSCEVLYGDYNAALNGGDRAYAETLADLGTSCGWRRTAVNELVATQSCPDGTVKLSDQSNQIQCVPCSTLYDDYAAAVDRGDQGYADSLIGFAGDCGWAQSVTEQDFYADQQEELDQRCSQQVPGSYAVINGDQYTCNCRPGMIGLSGPKGNSCQSCEQVRGYINAALQSNDIGSVRGLMAGAQSCGWYDQAVQIVADIEQKQRNYQMQQSLNASLNQLNTTIGNRQKKPNTWVGANNQNRGATKNNNGSRYTDDDFRKDTKGVFDAIDGLGAIQYNNSYPTVNDVEKIDMKKYNRKPGNEY